MNSACAYVRSANGDPTVDPPTTTTTASRPSFSASALTFSPRLPPFPLLLFVLPFPLSSFLYARSP